MTLPSPTQNVTPKEHLFVHKIAFTIRRPSSFSPLKGKQERFFYIAFPHYFSRIE